LGARDLEGPQEHGLGAVLDAVDVGTRGRANGRAARVGRAAALVGEQDLRAIVADRRADATFGLVIVDSTRGLAGVEMSMMTPLPMQAPAAGRGAG
jgi:hypothetical protein